MKKILSMLILSLLPPLFILVFSWYVGLFAKAKIKTLLVNENKKMVLKTFWGDYLNAHQVIRPMQEEFLKKGIFCKPIILLLQNEKKVPKYQMQNKAGCLCPDNCPVLVSAEILTVPRNVYEALEIKAHPVFALRKFFSYLEKTKRWEFPVVMEYDENSKSHLFYSLSMQK